MARRPDFLEVLLNESANGRFLFRRDPSITLDLAHAFARTSAGLPALAPEVALLYKAKNADIERNRADFLAARPALDTRRRDWLRNALAAVHPGHEWLGVL